MAATRTGQLWVIAAPSGAGKTSLVRALLERDPSLRFSISYTTRAPRSSEIDGRDYFFVTEPKFQEMVARRRVPRARAGLRPLVRHGARARRRPAGRGHHGRARDRLARRAASPRARAGLAERLHSAAERRRARAPAARAQDRLRGRDPAPAQGRAGRHDALDEFDHVIVNDDFATALERLAAVIAGREQGARTDLPTVRAAAEAIVGGRR